MKTKLLKKLRKEAKKKYIVRSSHRGYMVFKYSNIYKEYLTLSYYPEYSFLECMDFLYKKRREFILLELEGYRDKHRNKKLKYL